MNRLSIYSSKYVCVQIHILRMRTDEFISTQIIILCIFSPFFHNTPAIVMHMYVFASTNGKKWGQLILWNVMLKSRAQRVHYYCKAKKKSTHIFMFRWLAHRKLQRRGIYISLTGSPSVPFYTHLFGFVEGWSRSSP